MSIDSFGEGWLDGMFLEVDRKLTNMQNLELRGQPMSLRFAHAADKSQHDFGEPEEHGTVAGGRFVEAETREARCGTGWEHDYRPILETTAGFRDLDPLNSRTHTLGDHAA